MTNVISSALSPVAISPPDGPSKRSLLVAAIMIERVQDALANHTLHEGVRPGRFFEALGRKEWDHIVTCVTEKFGTAVIWKGDEHRFVPTSASRD